MKSLIIKSVAALCVVVSATSCMTTYDAYGRPVQSVDPGAATAGVVAAGVLGYALADGGGRDRDRHHHHYYRPAPRHRGHYYR